MYARALDCTEKKNAVDLVSIAPAQHDCFEQSKPWTETVLGMKKKLSRRWRNYEEEKENNLAKQT